MTISFVRGAACSLIFVSHFGKLTVLLADTYCESQVKKLGESKVMLMNVCAVKNRKWLKIDDNLIVFMLMIQIITFEIRIVIPSLKIIRNSKKYQKYIYKHVSVIQNNKIFSKQLLKRAYENECSP